MPAETKKKWIEKAYELFAEHGPEGLLVRKIAKEINVPRTTFYHHFADKEDLESHIIEYYIAKHESFLTYFKEHCKNWRPDLYIALGKYSEDLRFYRQLFRNRDNPIYNMFFLKTLKEANALLVPKFIEYYNLNIPYQIANDMYCSLTESWLSRLDPNDLTAASMQKLSDEIVGTLLEFAKSKRYIEVLEKNH